MRRLLLLLLLGLLLIPASAQDGLNLPTELYILLNEGTIERYGLGVSGVEQIEPSDQFIVDFRVAPDGNWFAYRTENGLFMRNMFIEDSTRQIEDDRASFPAIRGRGETMAWTNDSDALAYTTEYGGRVHFLDTGAFADLLTPDLLDLKWSPDGGFLAAGATQNVWWIFRRNGDVMDLTAAIPYSFGVDWLAEGQILYAPEEGGLTILDVAEGNFQTQLLGNGNNYFLPTIAQSGVVRVFVGSITSARLVELDIVTGEAQDVAIAELDISNARWAPNSELLIIFQGGALALIEPISGAGFTLPITTTASYTWGAVKPQTVDSVAVSQEGHFITPDTTAIAQVWRLPADNTAPKPITSAEMDVSEFAIAPDSSQLVYVSNSSLWLLDLAGEEPTEAEEVVMLGLGKDINPAWSPDSGVIYYRDDQDGASGIWIYDTASGESALFVADADGIAFTNPAPANGVPAIMLNRGNELVFADTNTGDVNTVGILGDGEFLEGTSILANGRLIRGLDSGTGLILADANDYSIRPQILVPILGTLRVEDYIALDETTIRVLIRRRSPGEVIVLDVPRDGSTPSTVANVGYITNPKLSRDGTAIAGLTSVGGQLVIIDLNTFERVRLSGLNQVSNFSW